jgi:3'(2'), 5'-bisphosphate nucleotidase
MKTSPSSKIGSSPSSRLPFNLPFSPLPETIKAIEAALLAGEETLDVYGSDFTCRSKEDRSPLTEADLRSDEIIARSLSSFSYPLLSEEGSHQKHLDGKQWIIDPLDGTADFVNKTGEFSVMIALLENTAPILGIVYWPTEKTLFFAEKGQGCYKITLKSNFPTVTRLHVNKLADLTECRAIVSRNHLLPIERSFLESLSIRSFRQKGSCGLKIADICEGNAELYFNASDKLKQWDTCAGYCLITEAGGFITDLSGEQIIYGSELYHTKGLLVTNGKINSEILEHYKIFSSKKAFLS